MNVDTFLLVEKICKFLQVNDSVRLTKILEVTQRDAEQFYPLIEKLKKRTLSQRLEEISINSGCAAHPFGLFGVKAEKDEIKKKIREDRMILSLELKNTIKTSPLSSDENFFLEIIYNVIY